MHRDYKNVNLRHKHLSEQSIRMIYLLVGLLFGLLVPSIFYSTDYSIQSTHDTPNTKPEIIKKAPSPQVGNNIDLQESFYQILPQIKINIPEKDVDNTKDNKVHVNEQQQNGTYIVQIGSFKTHDKANKLTEDLLIMGIKAHIKQTLIDDTDIRYQVRSGPYQSINDSMPIRKKLTDNQLHSILVKVKNE